MQASGWLHHATSWHSSLFPIKLRCASWHFIEILSRHGPACLLKRRLSRPSMGFCVATGKGEAALKGANREHGGAARGARREPVASTEQWGAGGSSDGAWWGLCRGTAQ